MSSSPRPSCDPCCRRSRQELARETLTRSACPLKRNLLAHTSAHCRTRMSWICMRHDGKPRTWGSTDWIRMRLETASGSDEQRPRIGGRLAWKPNPDWDWRSWIDDWTDVRMPATPSLSEHGIPPGCGSKDQDKAVPGWTLVMSHPNHLPDRAWQRRPDCPRGLRLLLTAALLMTDDSAIQSFRSASEMSGLVGWLVPRAHRHASISLMRLESCVVRGTQPG